MTSEHARVAILDREFAVACAAGEKPALLHAARTLDSRMRELRNQGASTRSFEQLLVVVALNLCNELRAGRSHNGEGGGALSDETLDRLIHKIDQALS